MCTSWYETDQSGWIYEADPTNGSRHGTPSTAADDPNEIWVPFRGPTMGRDVESEATE